MRLAVTALAVLAGDRITAFLIHQGWVMGLNLVIPLRIISALPILRFPFAGFWFALEVDKWDWYWLDAGSRSDAFQALYQEWDKVLDLFVLGMAAIVALGWRDPVMRAFALTAFVWRAVGVAAFVATGQEWLLVVFPNVFQSLFMMYVAYYLLSGRHRMLRSTGAAVLTILVALLPTLAEEYFIHVVGGRPWDRLHLPIPGLIEPQVWVVSMYLPALLLVVSLAIMSRGFSVDGDRETQLSAV